LRLTPEGPLLKMVPKRLLAGSMICLLIILNSNGNLMVLSKLSKGSSVPLASRMLLTPSYFRALNPTLGDKHHIFKLVFCLCPLAVSFSKLILKLFMGFSMYSCWTELNLKSSIQSFSIGSTNSSQL